MFRAYFRNVGIVTAAEVLLRLRTLILIPILTNAFGTVGYGIWTQVSVLVALLTPLVLLGTDAAMLRLLPGKESARIQSGFFTLIAFYATVSMAIAALLWLLAAPVARGFFEGAGNARYVAICGGVVFSVVLTTACRNYYRACGKALVYSAISIAQALYTTVISAIVAMSGGSIFDVVAWNLIADLALSAALLAHIAARFGAGRPDARLLKEHLQFGIVLLPTAYAMWSLNLIDRVVINYFGTLHDVGVYSVAYSLGYAVYGLVAVPAWVMYFPTASSLHNQQRFAELSRLYFHSTRFSLGLLIPAIAAMAVLGGPVLTFLTTSDFEEGAILVPLITLAYTLNTMASYYDTSLALARRQRWTTVSMVCAACLSFVLNVALVPRLGILGAAFAAVGSFALQLTISAAAARNVFRMTLDWRFVAKSCASAGVMAALLSLVTVGSLAGLLGTIVLGVILYGCGMVLLKALSLDEWDILLQTTGVSRFPGVGAGLLFLKRRGKGRDA